MKPSRLGVLIFSFVVFWLFCFENPKTLSATQQKLRENENVCFRWAFGARVETDNNQKLVPITQDTTLKAGDRFKMFVELKKRCFVYLIYHGAQGELIMLFPNDFQQFTDDYILPKKYYIPKGDLWFELDKNAGLERFYLLASAQRLTHLEGLLISYESANSTKKAEFVTKILSEIRKIKMKHRTFESEAERPVSIAGGVRGIKKTKAAPLPDISEIAAEISASNFYSRTFTIEHK